MRNKVWRSMAGTALLAVLVFAMLSMGVLYRFFTDQTAGVLASELSVIAAALNEGSDIETLAGANPDSRMTLIAADGSVLFDNRSDVEEMENHLQRPEIQEALEAGTGGSVRHSYTLGDQTIYRALRMEDGSILRISGMQKSVFGLLMQLTPIFVLLVLLTGLLSALASRQATERIVKPVNALNLDMPLDNDVYEELSPLLERMHQQNVRIQSYVAELTKQRTEFSEVTRNMAEALVLLNTRGEILFVNNAAQKLFHASSEQCDGQYLLAINRNFQIAAAMESALSGTSAEQETEINGRFYRVVASPVKTEARVTGAMMLIPDVTDHYLAEKARREFTANVSHELKTPLTTISGYAEIMQNGVAGEEKLREFAGLIRDEASKLIQLVEDIIKLSRLDENRLPPDRRRVSIKGLCEDAARRLAPEAEKKRVSIAIEGEECTVEGSPSMLGELVYNLIDNAVKYNRVDGKVNVRLTKLPDGEKELSVSDTGVGIDPSDQDHLFERFFRGDLSRSTPGTGLGLSIVKHVALTHGAKISLKSEGGKGTEICVRFPTQ